MIINIRGTSGSGKSTLVRRVMELYDSKMPMRRMEDRKRKQPHGYLLSKSGLDRSLVIIGHYETACGGCDTITKMDDNFRYAAEAAEAGFDVLFEGLLMHSEVTRTAALNERFPGQLLVIGLDVPLEVCIDSVNQRRWAKDPNKPPVNPKHTTLKWKSVHRCLERLTEAGVPNQWADREGAFQLIKEKLGL